MAAMADPAQDIQLIAQARLPRRCSAPGDIYMDYMGDPGPYPATPSVPVLDDAASDVAIMLYEDDLPGTQPATVIDGPQEVDTSPRASLLRQPSSSSVVLGILPPPCLETLPNEVLILIASFLDVDDLLHTSRTCHRLRKISLDPLLHHYRLRNTRLVLPPLLHSPCRPSLCDLMSRSIFLTSNTVISRRLARSLVSIRLSRRLATRPSAEDLVQRSVLPGECVPGMFPVHVAPGLVAKRKVIEKERLKDDLRRWIAREWKREVKEREEDAKKCDESHGIGRVWKLRRYWERVSRGDMAAHW